MPQRQHERGGAIVDDCRRFGATKQGKTLFEIISPPAALPIVQIVFEIAIILRDRAERFEDLRTERRPAEVRMDDDSGAVDYGLNFRKPQIVDRRPYATDNGGKVRHILSGAHRR